jgi:sphingomyelin phosphodiesterase acid-like 3
MKNNKKRFLTFNICLSLCLTAFFSAHCFAQTKQPTEKCLVVSDIHFSPLYGTPNDTALRKKLQATPIEEWKTIFENSKAQSTINVSLLYQDANYGILQSALDNMKKRLPHPAFIIIAGDFIWHGAKPADSVLKRKSIRFIAGLFKERFPDVTIIPAMGNNDTYGQDYALQDTKFLNDFANAWAPNLPKHAGDELKAQGYYTCTTGKLKIIVYNSALLNAGTTYPQAGAMMNWLQTSLADTKTKNVWLLTHIPPGTNVYNGSRFWNAGPTQTFINMVVQYSSKIKLGIASHTHFNDFRVFYNTANKPVSYMRIVPSICSNHGNNPSFEIAELNSNTSKVIKETNYYLNLAGIPNDKGVTKAEWNNTLELPSLFQMNKISAADFSKFMDEVKADKSMRLVDSYRKFYTVGTKIDSSIRVTRTNYLKYLKADSLKAK